MSKAVHLDDLPYQRDTCELFERIRDLPGAALLDSSFPHSTAGRYDILAANPVEQLPSLDPDADEAQCRQFFRDLGQYHKDRFAGIQPVSQDIPFCGGILGYLSYDLGNRLHGVVSGPGAACADSQLPATQVQAYDWCVIQDHLLRKATLVSQPGVPQAERNDVLARLRQPAPAPGAGLFDWKGISARTLPRRATGKPSNASPHISRPETATRSTWPSASAPVSAAIPGMLIASCAPWRRRRCRPTSRWPRTAP